MTNDSETTGEDVCACRHLRAKHDYGHGECYLSGCKCRTFEKAHAPTDDEREALIALMDQPITGASDGRTFTEMVVDAILAAGFRRTEVPEPSAECPQPCVHLSQEDAREGRSCAEHPCTCREPQGEPANVTDPEKSYIPGGEMSVSERSVQGEPTDAEVDAFKREWWAAKDEGGDGNKVRRGLRAAYEEGKKR